MAERGIGAVFDAARAGFAAWSPRLWDPVGETVVRSAAVAPRERVLDACCGMGSSAIPAATAVGRGGHVDAVDLAGTLVAAGRARAVGLDQLGFHVADVTTWSAPPYDAVLCVFGVFFLPDMDTGTAHLLGLLRPGGRIAVTTWARGSVEPLVGPFVAVAQAERARVGLPSAEPARSRSASDRVSSAEGLADWLTGVGAVDARVDDIRFDVPLTAALTWQFVTGSGSRAMLDGLDDNALDRVRESYLRALDDSGTRTFHVAALTAVGHVG